MKKKLFIILFCMIIFFCVPKDVIALEKHEFKSNVIILNEFKNYNNQYIMAKHADEMNDFCDENLRIAIRKYWKWISVLAPIALMIFIVIDFIKAMINNDADAIKKSSTNSIKRTIATMLLLSSPWLLSTIFNIFGLDICF